MLPPEFYPPIVIVAVLLVWAYQRTLRWPEYQALHGLKLRVVPLLERLKGVVVPPGLLLISRKGYRDDAEYLRTENKSVKEVWTNLIANGGSPHLINSIKVRETPEGEVQYSQAHVVWTHSDYTQSEAYLFDNGDGSTDVYAHHEPSVLTPDAHLHGFQSDGDPKGVTDYATQTQN